MTRLANRTSRRHDEARALNRCNWTDAFNTFPAQLAKQAQLFFDVACARLPLWGVRRQDRTRVAAENPGADLPHNLLNTRDHRLDLLRKTIECQLL
jgi:hypothetical protein